MVRLQSGSSPTSYADINNIITDNGTNFSKGTLARYASEYGIRLDLASVAHPQSNGQVESTNGLILSGIRPRLVEPLERAPGAWIDELPAVLWSLRTTPNRSTGFTPFFLVYGAEESSPLILSSNHLVTPCTRRQKPRKIERTTSI